MEIRIIEVLLYLYGGISKVIVFVYEPPHHTTVVCCNFSFGAVLCAQTTIPFSMFKWSLLRLTQNKLSNNILSDTVLVTALLESIDQ